MKKAPKPGSPGGKARARQLTPEELTQQALRAVNARWAKADAIYPARVRRALKFYRAYQLTKRTDAERAHRAHVARKRREAKA